jgi:hypothetical protein
MESKLALLTASPSSMPLAAVTTCSLPWPRMRLISSCWSQRTASCDVALRPSEQKWLDLDGSSNCSSNEQFGPAELTVVRLTTLESAARRRGPDQTRSLFLLPQALRARRNVND